MHILLLLAFMSLCRIKTIEQLRGKAPGELGKLMGLDRVPEVPYLRRKLDAMSRDEAAKKWAAALSLQWMEADPEAVGILYVDGHVRIYHGSKTRLPRKYVSRQRLCLRGTTEVSSILRTGASRVKEEPLIWKMTAASSHVVMTANSRKMPLR